MAGLDGILRVGPSWWISAVIRSHQRAGFPAPTHEHSQKAAICCHEEGLPGTESAGTLILDFQSPEL